jgi:hypothetical protein
MTARWRSPIVSLLGAAGIACAIAVIGPRREHGEHERQSMPGVTVSSTPTAAYSLICWPPDLSSARGLGRLPYFTIREATSRSDILDAGILAGDIALDQWPSLTPVAMTADVEYQPSVEANTSPWTHQVRISISPYNANVVAGQWYVATFTIPTLGDGTVIYPDQTCRVWDGGIQTRFNASSAPVVSDMQLAGTMPPDGGSCGPSTWLVLVSFSERVITGIQYDGGVVPYPDAGPWTSGGIVSVKDGSKQCQLRQIPEGYGLRSLEFECDNALCTDTFTLTMNPGGLVSWWGLPVTTVSGQAPPYQIAIYQNSSFMNRTGDNEWRYKPW